MHKTSNTGEAKWNYVNKHVKKDEEGASERPQNSNEAGTKRLWVLTTGEGLLCVLTIPWGATVLKPVILNLLIILTHSGNTNTENEHVVSQWKTPAEDVVTTKRVNPRAHINSKRSKGEEPARTQTHKNQALRRIQNNRPGDIAVKFQNGRVKVLQVSKKKKQSTKKRRKWRFRALTGEMANWLRALAATRAGKIWSVTPCEGKGSGGGRKESRNYPD